MKLTFVGVVNGRKNERQVFQSCEVKLQAPPAAMIRNTLNRLSALPKNHEVGTDCTKVVIEFAGMLIPKLESLAHLDQKEKQVIFTFSNVWKNWIELFQSLETAAERGDPGLSAIGLGISGRGRPAHLFL